MNVRESLSNALSLNIRKYFLGIVFVLISLLLLRISTGFFIFIAIILMAIGVFYLRLRKIEFDDEFVYVGAKKYAFNQLTKFSTIDVNLYSFPYIQIKENGRKRHVFTDSGQAGLLSIVVGLLIPSLDPMKNIKRFKQLFDASR